MPLGAEVSMGSDGPAALTGFVVWINLVTLAPSEVFATLVLGLGTFG